MEIAVNLTAVVFLLAINGFFVAAEFALVKARRFRIEAHANQGNASARLTLRIQAHLEAYLAACQLGITMASLGLGWVGEPAVAALLEPLFEWAGVPAAALHTSAFLVGFLIFSSLHIVIGEQVPKTFAIRKSEPVSIWVAYPLHIAYLTVWPLNWLLNQASRSILRHFGVDEAPHTEVLSGEEIRGLVTTSREHGVIHEDKADMLHNLFEFHQTLVARVMIPRNAIHAVDLSADTESNLEIIRETGHSRFPVIETAKEDKIIGLLLVKDIHRAVLAGESEPWNNLMRFCREPLAVPESQRVSDLFDIMRLRREHMAFVVDEYGTFVGIVTLEDLLEEIVGEIHDETDVEESSQTVIKISEGRWEADGLVSLNDLERIISFPVPEELDANTLSGFFMQRLARMPEPEDEIEEAGFRLRVLSVDERRVGKAAIEQIAHNRNVSAPEVEQSIEDS
ncbi:MAG: HlyC/CorC family transporter [Gammaproteobacteria bacterium]|nr:HlyC/CorC family transporter [Gammaproteobacteria bacterium]